MPNSLYPSMKSGLLSLLDKPLGYVQFRDFAQEHNNGLRFVSDFVIDPKGGKVVQPFLGYTLTITGVTMAKLTKQQQIDQLHAELRAEREKTAGQVKLNYDLTAELVKTRKERDQFKADFDALKPQMQEYKEGWQKTEREGTALARRLIAIADRAHVIMLQGLDTAHKAMLDHAVTGDAGTHGQREELTRSMRR